MRPQRRDVFRTDAASRLDDIELIAALLERDAVNGQASRVERGGYVVARRRRKRASRMRRARQRLASGSADVRHAAVTAGHLMVHPRVFACARASGGFIVDLAVVLATFTAGTAGVALVYLIAVPPV